MSAKTKSKPLAITISKVKRTRKRIEIEWTQGDNAFGLRERDNPLPKFGTSFDALSVVVAAIIHVPAEWCAQNLRVVGIVMGEMSGAETVAIVARKSLDDAAKEFAFTTPARLLANPSEPGTYTPPLSAEHAELVAEAVEQAKAYVKGDRAQGQIEFEGDEDEKEDGGEAEAEMAKIEELPLAAPDMPHNRKRTRRNKEAAAAR